LRGHISEENKQWREFSGNNNVPAIFMGSPSYISSSWYEQENVPTWNYQAVHVY